MRLRQRLAAGSSRHAEDAQPWGLIPEIIAVGVTGHRTLPHPERTARAVDQALALIVGTLPLALRSRIRLVAVSSLAEGADRLVAERVARTSGGGLGVVLPFPAERYLDDFATQDSRNEFHRLLRTAEWVRHVEESTDRDAAYRAAGHSVVERCDVLLAIWDGAPPRGVGGTAEIVRHAQRLSHPVVVIHPDADTPGETELASLLDVANATGTWVSGAVELSSRRQRATGHATCQGPVGTAQGWS